MTEKIYDAFAAGVVPVYLGAPNIDEYIPSPSSIIKASDFKDAEELGVFLKQVAEDPAQYQSYFEWRKHSLPSKLVNMLQAAEKQDVICDIFNHLEWYSSSNS